MLAKGKSLLRTVRTWAAEATGAGAIHLKNVEVSELCEGFYSDKATKTVLAPWRFFETSTSSPEKYKTLLLTFAVQRRALIPL